MRKPQLSDKMIMKGLKGGLHFVCKAQARYGLRALSLRCFSSGYEANWDDWHFVEPKKRYKPREEVETPFRKKEHYLKKGSSLTGEDMVSLLEENGALDIKCIALANNIPLGDWLVICTGRTSSHLAFIADAIKVMSRAKKIRRVQEASADWIVIDCGSVMTHLMLEETRERMQLEDYYSIDGGAKKMIWSDDLDVFIPSDVTLQSLVSPPQTARERRRRERRRFFGSPNVDRQVEKF